MSRPEDDWIIARTLSRVALTNPAALPLAAQLFGVPACPKCDYVMRTGHVCRSSVDANQKTE